MGRRGWVGVVGQTWVCGCGWIVVGVQKMEDWCGRADVDGLVGGVGRRGWNTLGGQTWMEWCEWADEGRLV